jgi:hypothetical protein
MPIDSTSANIDRLFSEKPNTDITASVPIKEIGIASSGITAVRAAGTPPRSGEDHRFERRVLHRVDCGAREGHRRVDDRRPRRAEIPLSSSIVLRTLSQV